MDQIALLSKTSYCHIIICIHGEVIIQARWSSILTLKAKNCLFFCNQEISITNPMRQYELLTLYNAIWIWEYVAIKGLLKGATLLVHIIVSIIWFIDSQHLFLFKRSMKSMAWLTNSLLCYGTLILSYILSQTRPNLNILFSF